MTQFEYKVLDVQAKGFWGGKIDSQELANKLNELGRSVWELVSSTDTNLYEGATRGLVMTLKRTINNEQ